VNVNLVVFIDALVQGNMNRALCCRPANAGYHCDPILEECRSDLAPFRGLGDPSIPFGEAKALSKTLP
jgi:hypothetical protein